MELVDNNLESTPTKNASKHNSKEHRDNLYISHRTLSAIYLHIIHKSKLCLKVSGLVF